MDIKECVEEVKRQLHILHSDDDNNLESLIGFAHSEIKGWCGEFELDNERGRGLVYEYVRFKYNGRGEYFYPAFHASLSSFGFDLLVVSTDGT